MPFETAKLEREPPRTERRESFDAEPRVPLFCFSKGAVVSLVYPARGDYNPEIGVPHFAKGHSGKGGLKSPFSSETISFIGTYALFTAKASPGRR